MQLLFFHERLITLANSMANDIAIKSNNECLTYEKILNLVNQTVGKIDSLGLPSQARVVLMATNIESFYILFLAITQYGLIPVITNPDISSEELEAITNSHRTTCNIGDDFLDDIKKYTPLNHTNSRQPNNELMIMRTSGTTKNSRGVSLSATNLEYIFNYGPIMNFVPTSKRSSFLGYLPCYHMTGFLSNFLFPLMTGGIVIAPDRAKDITALSNSIITNQISHLILMPSIFRAIHATLTIQNKLIKQDMLIWITGDKISQISLEQMKTIFPKAKRYVTYGLTEMPRSTVLDCDKYPDKLASVGLPVKNTKIMIIDDSNNKLNTNEVGLIIVKNESVARGYDGHSTNQESFLKDSWFNTGDIGYIDKDGFLYIIGRQKNMLKSNDFAVFPEKVEEVLLKLDEIDQAAVIGEQSNISGEIPVCYITLKKNIDDTKIIIHCKKWLYKYEVPKKIYIIDKMPRTSSGKICRRELTGVNK